MVVMVATQFPSKVMVFIVKVLESISSLDLEKEQMQRETLI